MWFVFGLVSCLELKKFIAGRYSYVMRLAKVLLGEFLVIIASVLIFRSLWTLMDQYLGVSYLLLFLVVGLILVLLGLLILNQELNIKQKFTQLRS